MSATQHSPVTPRSRTRVAQSKLRSSCDACGQAKIKCDRGQPACGRCISQGVACVYGVSRKAGKPPRKRPVMSASSLHQVPSRLPSRPGCEAEAQAPPPGIDLHGGGLDGTDLGIMLSMGEDAAGIGAGSPFSSSDAAFQSWFPFDTGFGGLGGLPSGSSDWDSGMGGHAGSALNPVESPATSTSASTASSTTAVAAPPGVRLSCTLETKDIMRRLYCTNPSAPAPDRLPARTLDLSSVLTRTSDIVVSLETLLKCPCARSPHMAMLYASIVSRILLWYRQAASQASPGRASPLSSASSPFKHSLAPHETLPPLSNNAALKAFAADQAMDDNSIGVSVPPMPVMVGTFQSDDQNVQTALVSCLLLNELKRVGGLIESFISLGTGTSAIHAAGDACPAADELNAGVTDPNLFASLGAWLRTEHGNIVRQARSGLSVLDENHGLQL